MYVKEQALRKESVMHTAKRHHQSGFTLIELIVAVALVVMTIALSTNMITLAIRSHAMTLEEYEVQSTVRMASAEINDIVRYSQAVFAVPLDYVETTANMDPGWNYFTVSADGSHISNFVYDTVSGTHREEIVVAASPNVEYEVIYEKIISATNDSLLQFRIVAHILTENPDGTFSRTSEKIVFESQAEALNAFQVVDKGTLASHAVALAYRNDSNATDTGRNQVAKVALVLDVSGSMADAPDGSSSGSSRITLLKEALRGFTRPDGTVVPGILKSFGEEDNIEIVLIPFSTSANYPSPTSTNLTDEHPYFSAKTDAAALDAAVNNLTANGNTNTGDGMRRALYRFIDFDPIASRYEADVEQYDYMIVLTDGAYNLSSWSLIPTRYWVQYSPWWGRYEISVDYRSQYIGRGGIRLGNYTNYGTEQVYDENSQNGTYINTIGQLIAEHGVKSYVIGYSDGITSQITTIGNALEAEAVYQFSDDFDLNEVFANIAQDIMAEQWLVKGPQIH